MLLSHEVEVSTVTATSTAPITTSAASAFNTLVALTHTYSSFSRPSTLHILSPPTATASPPDTMASSPTQQSSRLLDLPAEIRLNIYKLLIPEIGIKSLRPKLSISQPTTSQNKKHEKDKTSQSFNPGLQILFICRQIYAEVKPVVDTAPIVLFRAVWTETVDYSNQPPQCNLRVSKAIFDSWALLQFRHYLRRGMDRMAYGSGPGSLLHTFPNLRLVYFNQSKNPWNGYTAYHLELPKFIAKWLRDEQNSHEDKITGLLQHFEQIEGVTGREFKAIDSVIKENHLTLSMSYTWKMRGYKVNGRYLKLFMTEPNESVSARFLLSKAPSLTQQTDWLTIDTRMG